MKYITTKRTILWFAAVIFAATTHAQNTVRYITLNDCLATAKENSFALHAAAKQVEQRRAMEGTAWDIERTELSLSQDPTSGGSPDNALSIKQSIDFPTTYVARRRQLKAETQAQRSMLKMEENSLMADVISAYAELAYHAERISLFESNDSTLKRYTDVANKRHAAGEASRLELISAQRMRNENKIELQAAQIDLANAQTRLKLLMNVDYTVLPSSKELIPLPLPEDGFNYALTDAAEHDANQLNALRRAVNVAKGGYAPSLSVQLSSQMVISSWNPYKQDRSRFDGGNFMGFEASIGVPLFFGATKARVKAAKRECEAAEMQIQQKRMESQRYYAENMAKCHEAQKRIDFYNGEDAKQTEEISRLAQLEYEHGEIGYVEYAAALQTAFQSRMKRAAAINDFNQSVAQLAKSGAKQ